MSTSVEWRLRPMGMGADLNGITCFVSGKKRWKMPDLSGYVNSGDDATRLVGMFGGRAHVCPSARKGIQVKVGTLSKNSPALERLADAVLANGNVVTPEMIAQSMVI